MRDETFALRFVLLLAICLFLVAYHTAAGSPMTERSEGVVALPFLR